MISAPGTPLPAAARAEAERRFGRPFSDVRVHTDGRASASAADIQARAYTVGPHIAFAAGEYRPDTEAGYHLLLHELTHVAQHGYLRSSTVPVAGPLLIGPADSALEREADGMAHRIALTERLPGSGVAQPSVVGDGGRLTGVDDSSSAIGTMVRRQPATAVPPGSTEAVRRSSFSPGGKISFKTKELESPKAPAGPFEVYISAVFEVEAEIAPADEAGKETGTRARAEAGKKSSTAGQAEGGKEPSTHGEAGSEWEFRAGPTHSLGEAKDQGAQAELERKVADEWPGWLNALRPDKVKIEGEITGEHGELSLGAKWGDKPVNYELKLVAVGGKWEEGTLRILDVGLSQNQEAVYEWRLGGAKAQVTVKAETTVHAEPNWKVIGLWLAEQGITATAASAAAGVAFAYLAWVGFGFYELNQAVMKGRTQGMGFNFVEGYAEELAEATEQFPIARGDEADLLEEDWQTNFNTTVADYVADRIAIFAAISRAKRAGRACALQAIGNVLVTSGEDGWRKIASQHRSRYGVSQMSRSGYYKTIMFQQIEQKRPAGIDLLIR